MSAGPALSPDVVRPLADTLAELLSRNARRVLVGGSLRRGRPTVSDVEIIALCAFEQRPAPGQASLFGEAPMVRANATLEHVDRLVDSSRESDAIDWHPPGRDGCRLWLERGRAWGERYRKLHADYYERPGLPAGWPVGVDLFLVHDPAQWGWISTLRTGSSDFNQWLIGRLKSRGVTGDDGWLWRDGQRLPTPEEHDVFELAGTPFLEPHQRDPSSPQEVRRGRVA